jgi:hypothetical protein
MAEVAEQMAVDEVVAEMRRDYSALSARIRELGQSVKSEFEGITLRLHFPAIRQGKATVGELVDAILDYMTTFALPRSAINDLLAGYGKISGEEYRLRSERLQREAISLFKRAQKATNRNGEAGELLLCVLTEWILGAPQLLAKMCLKTNRDMPVHGADGLHVGYSPENKHLYLYWGESKLYSDVREAIQSAAKSIQKALDEQSIEFELKLVSRHIDLTGLSSEAKDAILSYLDPFDESYNRRADVTTCLVGFDFDAYRKLAAKSELEDEQLFRSLALAEIRALNPMIAGTLKSAGIQKHLIELFLFPLPSVQNFRDIFQAKIGWKT